jgi:hypothetical protein
MGLVLVGCSSGKATSDGGTDGAVTTDPVDDFLPAVRNAICERAVACLEFPDVATCLMTPAIGDGYGVEAWVSSVKRGNARFDPTAAAVCLDSIPRDCLVVDPEWQFTRWLWQYLVTPPCLAAFIGTAQPNEVCGSTVECANKHCGGGSPCPGGGAIGVCRPSPDYQAPGATCDGIDALCEFDAMCGPDGTCLGPLPMGASCSDTTPPCARGTICQSPDGVQPRTCVNMPATGAACDATDPRPCARIDDTCDTTTNVCTRRRKPGQPCTQNECVAYADCESGVCTMLPVVGQACSGIRPCVRDILCMGSVCTAAKVASCP